MRQTIHYAVAVAVVGLLFSPAWPVRAQVPARPTVREVIDEDVDRAIQRTIRYIVGRQAPNGDWPGGNNLPGGGPTALAVFALLDADSSDAMRNNPAVAKGIGALIALKTAHSYVRSLRLMAFSLAGGRNYGGENKAAFLKVFADDKAYLLTNAAAHGAWGYGGPDRTGDNSASQFALLALWEANRAGEEIPAGVIKKVEATWLGRQLSDGGWTYAGTLGTKGDPTPSMTAAGLASLYVCQDLIEFAGCKPYGYKKELDDASGWLIRNLKPDFVKNGYLAFCVQRVGLAGGVKFLGTMDWFSVGARELVKPQPFGPSYVGQWGPDVDACFQLLFLSRGRVPLVFNKLALGAGTGWDTHSRDVSGFAEYMRRRTETRIRWQVARLGDDMRMLLDAPILLATSTQPAQMTETEWGKLRDYSLQGGMLLFMPVHDATGFTDSVKARLATLYEAQATDSPKYYKIEPIRGSDPIYSAMRPIKDRDEESVKPWTDEEKEAKLPLLGVSDGTRWLAVVSPTDIACAWQKVSGRTQTPHFLLAMNMYTYATGKNALGSRMRPVFVGADKPAKSTIKVGWVRHDGNWNAQPFALNYLSQKLAAENWLALDVTVGVDPASAKLDDYKLLWITGSDAFTFSDAAVRTLRQYLDNNGTIFLNAVGGSPEFNASTDALLARLKAGRAGRLLAPADNEPLISGKLGEQRGLPIDKAARVRAWMVKVPANQVRGPVETYVEGDWARVVIGRNGIHDTLDGHTNIRSLSYMPSSAGQIAANVVLYSIMDRPKPPPAPASQPTTRGD